MTQLSEALAEFGVWTRLHYVYPYPHVDEVIPLMAEGKILPYLDIPFQHASPKILKAIKRPAFEDSTMARTKKSAERQVGTECVSKCKTRWSANQKKKKKEK